MVEYNETSRDGNIDSTGPQMSELVPADGSLFRPSHRPAPSNPNVFSDDYSIGSIDAPLFSDHRTHSFSSCDSVSTIEARNNNNVPPAMVGNVSRANLLEQQADRQSLASIDQPDEPLTLGRTATNHTEDDAIDDEETELDPFADQPSSSLLGDDRPSSIRKGITALNRQSTISTTTSTRSGYTAVPRAMSPYRGATGPSHPYAMYPQVGVARTPSIATVSTIRRGDSPMRERNAPQHPYGMYRQNIDYEEDLGDQPIPVGFPSRGTQPQGTSAQADEVGDIVGPDGHLEQLPPYSRYPDGIIRPTSGRGPASVASEMRERWERYQDEPRSRSNLSTGTLINADDTSERVRPQSSVRTQSPPSDRSSTLVASASLDEKSRRKGERKCCGAPIWLVVTLTMAMITCALVGGVIGGVLGERAAIHRAHVAHQSHSADVVTVTYTSDVSPYTATPTGFGVLPTGNYQIPWTITNVSKFCVGTALQMQSWSCQVAQPLAIDIQGSSYLSSSITVEQPQIENGQINYGAQPPYDIIPARQPLYVMIDKEDPELGPALFFQTFFNKLVIVPDSPLMQPTSKRSLSETELSAAAKYEELDAMTDSMKPWFCWWNQTQIETFIYINQTRDGLSPTATTATTKMTAASITSHTSTTTPTAGSSGIRNYPRKIKIKENRVNPNAPTAYCQQMQVHSDHSITPIPGRRIEINETVITSSNWSGTIPCHCEWLT